MKPSMPIRSVLFLFCAVPLLAAADADSDLARMVQAEYEFSAMATRTTQRAAFLEYIAADGILFRPGPVNAQQALSQGKGSPGILHWYPSYAEISGRGDLGLTSGPWIYWGSGQAAAYGHFVSIWRKQPNGEWRNVLDGGIGHAAPSVTPARLVPAARDAAAAPPAASETDLAQALQRAEAEYARLNGELGVLEALTRVALPSVRVYRDDHEPFIGLEAARAHLATAPRIGTWTPDIVRSSADFGYSYGVVTGPEAGSKPTDAYVHVWKHQDGQWRLLLDLLIPMQ